jgi:hypothetical protein
MVTASQDAGAGWIDRWDQGIPVRFARAVPDPLAFEREYLSVLTGETVTRVRPDPDITISFDGERCTIQPGRMAAGDIIVAYADARHPEEAVGILLQLSDAFTYEELRAFLGPDGSILPADTQPPDGLRISAFLQEGLAEAETHPSVIAGVCTSGGDEDFSPRVWLTAPVEVAPQP